MAVSAVRSFCVQSSKQQMRRTKHGRCLLETRRQHESARKPGMRETQQGCKMRHFRCMTRPIYLEAYLGSIPRTTCQPYTFSVLHNSAISDESHLTSNGKHPQRISQVNKQRSKQRPKCTSEAYPLKCNIRGTRIFAHSQTTEMTYRHGRNYT